MQVIVVSLGRANSVWIAASRGWGLGGMEAAAAPDGQRKQPHVAPDGQGPPIDALVPEAWAWIAAWLDLR